ncbi:MAG: hypothetical protein IKL07_04490, partial [Clostridium sp.]|nr:hypothetical protein [Clostridium sp.]
MANYSLVTRLDKGIDDMPSVLIELFSESCICLGADTWFFLCQEVGQMRMGVPIYHSLSWHKS